MKLPLVLCALLGVILSVSAAVLPFTFYTFPPYTSELTDTTPPYTSELTETTPPYTSELTETTPPYTSELTETTIPYTSELTETTPPYTSELTETTPYITTTTSGCVTSGPSWQSQILCPKGWQVFQGQCYRFVNEDLTWPQAQLACALLESTMVSVHSAQEYNFLQQLTNSNENQNAWLGGFCMQDTWLWLDGSWFSNNTWSNKLPDSSNPCLLLNSYEAWSNAPSSSSNPSICVKTTNVPQAIICPEGWMGFQGRCYYYNNDYLTWTKADANCAALGASLVSVHSPQEYSFLYQQTTAAGSAVAWLGGIYIEDQWIWLDGSWFYRGFFTAMSPNNYFSCLATCSSTGWSNFECEQPLASFCVKDTVV